LATEKLEEAGYACGGARMAGGRVPWLKQQRYVWNGRGWVAKPEGEDTIRDGRPLTEDVGALIAIWWKNDAVSYV